MVLVANAAWALLALVLDLTLAVEQSQDGHYGSTTSISVTETTSIDATTTSITTTAAATTTTSSPSPTTSAPSTTSSTASVCEARTINYITHSLPQLCYTSTWSGTSAAGTTSANETSSSPSTDSASADNAKNQTATASPSADQPPAESSTTSDDEPAATPFMSFEDWKEMMLRRQGQDPQDIKQRKPGRNRGSNDRTPLPDMGSAGLGEEGEISLDFDEYLDKPQGNYGRTPGSYDGDDGDQEGEGDYGQDELMPLDGDYTLDYRSKDAGKTCKERFSYSSFDAGATIVKTSPGAKNPKAILVENKDSYMLLECAAESKYVIVELSDDILVDTVVLANFEFFSSMIHHFRVSVSALYPVKTEHWRELGVFEARNSRDIQPFLVEHPHMWAKYVRIEFLTQYGKEYYCPVSLIRIHGSRMLDGWKKKFGQDEALLDDGEEGARTIEDGSAEPTDDEEPFPAVDELVNDESVDDSPDLFDISPFWSSSSNLFNSSSLLCSPDDFPGHVQDNETNATKVDGTRQSPAADPPQKSDPVVSKEATSQTSSQDKAANSTSSSTASPSSSTNATRPVASSNSASSNTSSSTNYSTQSNSKSNSNSSTPSATKTTNPPSSGAAAKHRDKTASAPSASPTVQESFFNAITKRLNNVESNLTLSLQYLEDHSRYLQEALLAAEHKQVAKVATFLDDLNQTVFSELRGMRDQYEQIWQSTVIALETQREQSERDVVALGARLNLLADEVVFQKRMAIVQAVLLLCCLFLVIFSRGVPIPYLAPLLDQQHGPVSPSYVVPSPQTQASMLYANGSSVSAGQPRDASYSPQPTNGLRPRDQTSEGVALGEKTFPELPQPRSLSPPLTPGSTADSESSVSTSGASFDVQTLSHRRSLNSQHNARKPLPALPEHPSPS